MHLSTGYLTSKQSKIWGLKISGKQEAQIARELNITRQTVHQTMDIANKRIFDALKETAQVNKIEINMIDESKGILSGYSPHFDTKAYITFSAKNGVQIWYKHEGHCNNCKQLKKCREMLVAEANERNFLLTDDIESIVPSKLAQTLLSKLSGETDQ